MLLVAGPALACGPFFPNTLLDQGDAGVLAAPVANFELELERLKLAPSAFQAVITTNDYPEETMDAEIRDLRAALKDAQAPDDQREAIVARHAAARERLRKLFQPSDSSEEPAEPGAETAKTTNPASGGTWPELAGGLPAEFADYFTGSVAWHAALVADARADWEKLLARPAAERHYRSTWAAYMLGRSWHDKAPEKAAGYYQQVRALAKAGFADSLGLAAASLGWEAQLCLRQKRHAEAMGLYLDQLSAGDDSAVNSLRFAAGEVVTLDAPALEAFAAHPQLRRVVTAYLISHPGYFHSETVETTANGEEPAADPVVRRWLAAAEAANVTEVECAEELALAAYQNGAWNLAQRWINRSRATPTAQWLQAKLLLRAGRTADAAALLAQVARQFPLAPDGAERPAPTSLADTLSMPGFISTRTEDIGAPNQVRGELGVFCLTRRDYTEALDALLRSGFWMDAAYVAERVMTTDELKSYVDRNWPAPEKPAAKTSESADEGNESSRWDARDKSDPAVDIRYLLARRLARLNRFAEAREYFPERWQAPFDELVTGLGDGANESTPAAARAEAFFAAAWLARTNGLELLGTEVEPDWAIHGGDFQEGVSIVSRQAEGATNHLPASAEELERAAGHGVWPEVRWHYRDLAALLGLQAAKQRTNDFHAMSEIIKTAKRWLQSDETAEAFYKDIAVLGWQAAKALPDNTDETARVLCTAGSWIKNYDPKAADVFYKALVRRCGQTAIGQQADRKRWFPLLDEQGNLLPWKPNPPRELPTPDAPGDTETAAPPPPPTCYRYALSRGNTLGDVVEAAQTDHGLTVTAEALLEANPGIDPQRLKIGQIVVVPVPSGAMPAPDSPEPTEPVTPPLPDAMPGTADNALPAATPAADGSAVYVVRAGDTLAAIMRGFWDRGFRFTHQQLVEANPGLDIRALKIGQRLVIPGSTPAQP